MMMAGPLQAKFFIKFMLYLRVGKISFDLTELHSHRLLRQKLNAERKLRNVSGTVLNKNDFDARELIEPCT